MNECVCVCEHLEWLKYSHNISLNNISKKCELNFALVVLQKKVTIFRNTFVIKKNM